MATNVLYGDIGFTNRTARDRGLTLFQTEIAARGLTAEAYDIYPAGIIASGTRNLTISVIGTTEVVDQASADLQNWLNANGQADGNFGSGWLRD